MVFHLIGVDSIVFLVCPDLNVHEKRNVGLVVKY